MPKKMWDLYAPIYERAMRSDRKTYQFMYDRIPESIQNKDVLEIATGPGLLAKHVASASKTMIATDYSEGMIAQATKGVYPTKLRFEVADATALPYEDDSFDAVIIANALHIIPEPERALKEIDRVLKPGGIMIAPNFVEHKGTAASRIWSGILRIAGIRFEHQWSAQEYLQFLEVNGWKVTFSKEMAARIALIYTECIRKNEKQKERRRENRKENDMFEKVNPAHPDKVADRIAGALVDLAYALEESPKIAIEVLLGHGNCHIIAETSVRLPRDKVTAAVSRIAGDLAVDYAEFPQDVHLAENQNGSVHCGDNGIFKGVPITDEQKKLTALARQIYDAYKSDGKYILDGNRLIICQSNADSVFLRRYYADAEVNPLGDWTGGSDVDSGATNRKLGSDMGDSVTGGGLHGKDLSKADVSVNIYAWLKAQETLKPVELCCAIGDDSINGVPYGEIVAIAKEYIRGVGGFEKFAEWGLIR